MSVNKKKVIFSVLGAMLFAVSMVITFCFLVGSDKTIAYILHKIPDKDIAVPMDTEPAVTQVVEVVTTQEFTTVVTEPPEITPYGAQDWSAKANDARAYNSDIVGWINITNTNISQPVVQAADNEYYLKHSPYKAYSNHGALFMDFRNNFGEDEAAQSDNIIIYGHYTDAMFKALHNYKNIYSFYEENPVIELSSLYENYLYKIYAFGVVYGVQGTDFEFWNYVDFPMHEELSAEEDFNHYLHKVEEKTLIRTNVDVKFGDKLLTLSTCNSATGGEQYRFVIFARRLREGERVYEGTKDSVRLK